MYVAVFAFAGMSSWVTRNAAVGQLNVIRNGLAEKGGVADTTSGPCALLLDSWNASACLATLGPGRHTYFGSLIEYRQLVAENVSATSLQGALGFGSRQSASMIGFIALALVVAVHVTSLWDSGVARPALVALGSTRIVLQKSVTALVAPAIILVSSTLGVIVASFVPVHEPLPGPEDVFGQSVVDGLRSYWMLSAVGLLTVAVGVLARQLMITFAVVVGLLALSFVGTLNATLYPWSPAGWIATLMHFSANSYRQVVDSFWAKEVGEYSGLLMGLAVSACALIPLGLAVINLHRRRLKA